MKMKYLNETKWFHFHGLFKKNEQVNPPHLYTYEPPFQKSWIALVAAFCYMLTGLAAYFKKYLCPCGVLAISQPGGSGCSSTSSQECWRTWCGGGGAVLKGVCCNWAGDEWALIWTVCIVGGVFVYPVESVLPSRLWGFLFWGSGGVKNEAGKFLIRRGTLPVATLALGSATWNSLSISSLLLSRTCSTWVPRFSDGSAILAANNTLQQPTRKVNNTPVKLLCQERKEYSVKSWKTPE